MEIPKGITKKKRFVKASNSVIWYHKLMDFNFMSRFKYQCIFELLNSLLCKNELHHTVIFTLVWSNDLIYHFDGSWSLQNLLSIFTYRTAERFFDLCMFMFLRNSIVSHVVNMQSIAIYLKCSTKLSEIKLQYFTYVSYFFQT